MTDAYSTWVNYPKGIPKSLYKRRAALKFKTLGYNAIPNDKKLDKIAETLFNLEEVENVRDFVELLRKD